MAQLAKPHSLRRALALGLALALGFSALSVGFLVLQARQHDHRIAGEVIAVEAGRITIRSGRGRETVLIVPPELPVRGVSSVAGIAIGQHVMSRGSFAEKGMFEVERLRVLTDFKAR